MPLPGEKLPDAALQVTFLVLLTEAVELSQTADGMVNTGWAYTVMFCVAALHALPITA